MIEPGFVYALINVSSLGLVKVGKTSKDPQERANELSRATGIPTPFVVAFKRLFRDATIAESFVHTFLEAKGYRIAPNREFFSASLEDVVEAILQAPGAVSSSSVTDPNEILENTSRLDRDSLDTLDVQGPWNSLLEEARAYQYGLGDVLQDLGEAVRLYKQAAALGATEAFRSLGRIYHYGGEKSFRDPDRALQSFKEGARRGDAYCYAEMAGFYEEREHWDNCIKCWDQFFANAPASKLAAEYACNYFIFCKRRDIPLSHIQRLHEMYPEILNSLLDSVKLYLTDFESSLTISETTLNVIGEYRSFVKAFEEQCGTDAPPTGYSRSIEIDRELALAYNNRGLSWYRKGDAFSAIINYDEAIETDPGCAQAYGNRGVAHLRLGDKTKAEQDFKKCFELDSSLRPSFEKWSDATKNASRQPLHP